MYLHSQWKRTHVTRFPGSSSEKLDYLLDKDLIDSPEQFIKRGASESSFSGEPYRVRCQGAEQLSAEWLNAELKRLRSANR